MSSRLYQGALISAAPAGLHAFSSFIAFLFIPLPPLERMAGAVYLEMVSKP